MPRHTRLTEAEAQTIADEIERGEIDLEWHRVEDLPAHIARGRGRPSLTGASEPSPRVSFRLAPDIRDRAAAVAEREGKTVSALAREALERYLDAS